MLAVGSWSFSLRQEQWAPCAEKLRVSGVYLDLLILAPTLAAGYTLRTRKLYELGEVA